MYIYVMFSSDNIFILMQIRIQSESTQILIGFWLDTSQNPVRIQSKSKFSYSQALTKQSD